MTFEQCHANLMAIRRRQGTRCPVVKVAYNGMIYQGRLTRADSDPEYPPSRRIALRRARPGEPRPRPEGPETILQIANIPEDGIADLAA